jgi:hypothetical protein
MVVAVYEDDYGFIPGQSPGRPTFGAYWRRLHARASELRDAGTTPLLRPLVDVEFRRFCRDSGLRPGSAAAFEAYAQRQVPRDELVEFDGLPVEPLRRLMVYERDAAAMMWACELFVRAVVEQFGDEAKVWALGSARRVLDAVVAEASAGDTIIFVSKLGDGQPLGSYALAAGGEAGAASDARRDRTRLSTLMSTSLLVPASGALALRSERENGTTVQVWEYARQRFTPSEHGRLILEAHGGDEPSVQYVPGFDLPQPA